MRRSVAPYFFAGVAGTDCGALFSPENTEEPLARREFRIERVIEVIMKMIAHQVVSRVITVAAPRGPKAVWLPCPPNAAARSALLPLCSSTTMIRNKETKI